MHILGVLDADPCGGRNDSLGDFGIRPIAYVQLSPIAETMNFTAGLRRLTERAEILREQGATEDGQRSLLASIFRLLAREKKADVTIEKATASGRAAFSPQTIERISGCAEAEERMHIICESGTSVVLAFLAGSNRVSLTSRPERNLQGKSLQGEEAEALWRLLEGSGVRFGVLACGHRLRFYARFGDVERPVLDFDLLSYRRQEAEQLKALLEAILAFGQEEGGGPLSVGRGLLYVLAVDNGEPFGHRETTCKFGITGVGPESRRRFHEWRLGLQNAEEELRLCYLAAGSVVAAEKPIRRKTSDMALPGFGPRSEWRWCPPKRLVEKVKETTREQIRKESDRLGLGLTCVRLADPLTSADSSASEEHSDTPNPVSQRSGALGEVGSSGEPARKGNSDLNSTLGDRLSPEAARRRAAKVKRKVVRGDLGGRENEDIITFRTSGREDALLRECAEQSVYQGWSAYVRDQILGWSQAASIVSKAGLFVHWVRAHWGREVTSEEWCQLRGLAEEFFNPDCIPSEDDPSSEDTFREDPLRKVLMLVRRHLLAVEPQPLQLLKEQLIKMERLGELERITAPVQGESLKSSGKTGWAREVRRHALGVSGKEEGHRTTESIRMAHAEREVVKKNVQDSSYANLSSYARNYALGWNRDVLACAWAAAVTTWLARRLGQSVGEASWKRLEAAMEQVFDPNCLPGAPVVGRGLGVVEEHLLQVSTERVTEETVLLHL